MSQEAPGSLHTERLLAEYRAGLSQSNLLAIRIETTAVLGVLFLTLVAAYTITQRVTLPVEIAWAVPFLFLAVFAALTGLAAQQVAAAWQARILALQLHLAGLSLPPASAAPDVLRDLVARFIPAPPASAASRPDQPPTPPAAAGEGFRDSSAALRGTFNLWRHSWALRLLALAPFLLLAGVFAAVTFISWRSVYNFSHVQGSLFFLLYAALLAIEGVALADLFTGLPRHYRALYAAVANGKPLDEAALPPRFTPAALWRFIVPLPGELVRLGWAYWTGFLAALLLGGLQFSQFKILNTLFRHKVDWAGPGNVPSLAVIALGLLVFIASEVLLQQALALWRARLSANPAARLPSPGALLRWLLGLALGLWLGGLPMLALFLAATAFEALSILVFEPRRARWLAAALLVRPLGLPARFFAGVLVWGGGPWALVVYQFLAVVIYFLALASDARRVGLPRWRGAGYLAATLTALALLILHILAQGCIFEKATPMGDFYGTCVDGGLVFSSLGLLNGLLIAFDVVVVLLLLSLLLVRLLGRPLSRLFAPAAPRLRRYSATLFVLAAGLAVVALLREQAAWAFGALACGTLGAWAGD